MRGINDHFQDTWILQYVLNHCCKADLPKIHNLPQTQIYWQQSQDHLIASHLHAKLLYIHASIISAVVKWQTGNTYLNRFVLLIAFLRPFVRPWQVSAFRTLPLAAAIDDILVPTIFVFSSVFTSAIVSIIDSIVASSRPTESIDVSDSDDRENFRNDRKARRAGYFSKSLSAPLIL